MKQPKYTERDLAAARLAASRLLAYPDDRLLDEIELLATVVSQLPPDLALPLQLFLDHLAGTPLSTVQEHFVSIFDMRRRACPYLTYWTEGDTRNRGASIVRFQQAYSHCGFEISRDELPDHLAVVLEFTAICDQVTGSALLAEHAHAIGLLREALSALGSVYVHVLDAVLLTLPEMTDEIREAMAQLAQSGPPGETVGLQPFSSQQLHTIGARR